MSPKKADTFCICAAARKAEDGVIEAHVFAATKPKKKFDLLMVAAKAAADDKPYHGAEFRAANTWLCDVVRLGKTDDVRLVVLEDGIVGQNATKLPKMRHERDLLALGVRLPVAGPDDRDSEQKGIQQKFREVGIHIPSASVRSLRELGRQCGPDMPECERGWAHVEMTFRKKGHVHGQTMRAINDLLLCFGYNLNMTVSEDGSARMSMWSTDSDCDRIAGDVNIRIGVTDVDGPCDDIDFIDSRRDDQLMDDEARTLSTLASVGPLLKWHGQLMASAVEQDIGDNPLLLDYRQVSKTTWHLRATDAEKKDVKRLSALQREISEMEAKSRPPESVYSFTHTAHGAVPMLHLTDGRQWSQDSADIDGNVRISSWELKDGTMVSGSGAVDGRGFLSWAKHVGDSVGYQVRSKVTPDGALSNCR